MGAGTATPRETPQAVPRARETPLGGLALASEAGAVSAEVAEAASVETRLRPGRAGTGVASGIASLGKITAVVGVIGVVRLLGVEVPMTAVEGLVVVDCLVVVVDLVAGEVLVAEEALEEQVGPWRLAPALAQLEAGTGVGVGVGLGMGVEVGVRVEEGTGAGAGGGMVSTERAAHSVAAPSIGQGRTQALGGSGRQARWEVSARKVSSFGDLWCGSFACLAPSPSVSRVEHPACSSVKNGADCV